MPLICFASPKGGVGKSTLAANVAWEMAKSNWTVIALDLDPQNALRLHFGMPLNDVEGFMNSLSSGRSWRNTIRNTASGVHVLPYGGADFQDVLWLSERLARQPELLEQPLAEILEEPNVAVILDTEPGASASLAAALPRVDLLVTTLRVDALSSALVPAIETGHAYGLDWSRSNAGDARLKRGYVFNQFDPRTKLGPMIADRLIRRAGTSLIGIVHQDEHVAEAAAAQQLVGEYAPAAQAADDIRHVAHCIRDFLNAESFEKVASWS